jgi:hypothetical protein
LQKGQRADGRRADVLEGKGATLPVGEIDERRRQQLISERQREYNEQQQQVKFSVGLTLVSVDMNTSWCWF